MSAMIMPCLTKGEAMAQDLSRDGDLPPSWLLEVCEVFILVIVTLMASCSSQDPDGVLYRVTVMYSVFIRVFCYTGNCLSHAVLVTYRQKVLYGVLNC